MNIQGVFLNALGDSLGSVAVIVSGLLIKFVPPFETEKAKWKLYVDPTLSLIIACIIIASTVPLLKKSSLILLQGVPLNCNINELRDLIKSVNGITDVHHFHVWSLNSEKLVASAHIRLAGEKDEARDWQTVNEVKRLLHRKNIHWTTIQLEHDEASLDSCDEDCGNVKKVPSSNHVIKQTESKPEMHEHETTKFLEP